jgi:maltooligosyltrehalose trehalohydrolase
MTAEPHGYYSHAEPGVCEGQLYAFRLDGGPERPDPCSLSQPEGVHGPSAVVASERFPWTDREWRGIDQRDLAIYELHVGTFTNEGTFDAVIPRLRELRDLGVTAIELMPVAQFPGSRDWGYDGVALYAPQNSYGGPHGLERLVDACHSHGLAVILDVVYNHLGPEGNYLREFGPYFTDRYRTPWGEAVNYDGPGCDAVRDFVLDNVRMWLEEFHCDGLRLDAVHAIFDLGARHILRSIQDVADEVARRTGRSISVIAESDLNDPRLLVPSERGGHGLAGQWADDFHHAIHSFLTQERDGYYSDFGAPLNSPFLYAWTHSTFRNRKHGAPVPAGVPANRFVVGLQNHDQVGNRPRGDRLSTLLNSPAQLRLAASLMLLSPYTPLLFMGEEYGETNPFPFFCSFSDRPLVEAVREGRKREFADFAWQGEVPDPQSEATFAAARLSWCWPAGSPRAGLRQLYTDLLAARRLWPALRDSDERRARLVPDEESGPVLALTRGSRGSLQCIFNLSGTAQPLPAGLAGGGLRPLFRSESPRYTADETRSADGQLPPWGCVVFGPKEWSTFV